MARDREPMTEEEMEQAEEDLHDLFDAVREALPQDLGGEPDDYRADPCHRP